MDMEVSQNSRRVGRRPERAMYVVPGRRSPAVSNTKEASHSGGSHRVTTNDVVTMINSKGDAISGDRVVEILNFLIALDDSRKEDLESLGAILIKFSMFLMEHQISSLPIMEKFAVLLNLVGKRLEKNFSHELDSLLTIMRDKFIKEDISPEARRYIWSVIESRARKWDTLRHV